MDQGEMLRRMDDRIKRTELRVDRLTSWLRWTRYPEVVNLARTAAVESLQAWRALRATLITTWTLVKRRRRN
jgi:hypothetical protein